MVRYEQSIMQGRSSLWCCLCCGMPFTYPEEGHDIPSDRVQALISVSRAVRLGTTDPEMPHTQWNSSLSGLLSGDMVVEVMEGTISVENQEDWGSLVEAVVELTDSLNVSNGDFNSERLRKCLVEDKGFAVCEGCISVGHELIGQGFSGLDKEDNARTRKKLFSTNNDSDIVPNACLLLASHVSGLVVARLRTGAGYVLSEPRAWRAECLTRLYIGKMIYTLLASYDLQNLAFEPWYMYVFHPLIEWENIFRGDGPLSDADFTVVTRANSALQQQRGLRPPEDEGGDRTGGRGGARRGLWNYVFGGGGQDEEDEEEVDDDNDEENFNYASVNAPRLAHSVRALRGIIKRVASVCSAYPFVCRYSGGKGLSSGSAEGARYAELSRTEFMLRIYRDPSIPWAPACVSSYGISGDVLLGRLRLSLRGRFGSNQPMLRVLENYLLDESGKRDPLLLMDS